MQDTPAAASAADQPQTEAPVVAYKGFDKDWKCRGFQYKVGKTYTHEGPVKACQSGFHACEHPLDVFGDYAPADSRFALVQLSGSMSRESGGDTKVAAENITIKAELSLSQIIQSAVDWVFARSKPEGPVATGDQGAASVTVYRGAASTSGNRGAAIAAGNRGAASATGDQGAAVATGIRGAAVATGDQGAASAAGNRGAAIATGIRGVAIVTGDRGAAIATSDQGAAIATGDHGVASATGCFGRAMGKEGNALFLLERNYEWNIVAAWAGIAGRDGIKPMTWYELRDGKPVEVA